MSTQTKFSKQTVLGVEVDKIGLSEAIDHILDLVSKPKSCYIVKPYVEYLDAAASDKNLRQLLNQAYLALPDGVSLNWATYFALHTNHRLRDLVKSLLKIVFRPLDMHLALPNYSWGTNFTWSLLQAAAESGRTVFLVGSPKNSTINQTKTYLEQQMPRLKIVGTQTGRDNRTSAYSDRLENQLLKTLRKLRPDIVLIGIGFPAQERLCARLAGELDHGILIGEGGTFDFKAYGGHLPKAPTFMQYRGLEWLWRLVREPARFRRQLAIPRFIWKVYKSNQQK